MKIVNVVVPVYNEAKVLKKNIIELVSFLDKHLNYDFIITIANNASTDKTGDIADELEKTIKKIKHLYLDRKGRGYALKEAWSYTKADVHCYMDVDLSTDIKDVPLLISKVLDDKYDVVVGSRLNKKSVVSRSIKREFLSRIWNLLVKFMFKIGISDTQCGFKAVNQRVVDNIIPLIENNNWFFDTELLLIAKHKRYKIGEIPVKWIEDNDSKVVLLNTVIEDIMGLLRMRKFTVNLDERK